MRKYIYIYLLAHFSNFRLRWVDQSAGWIVREVFLVFYAMSPGKYKELMKKNIEKEYKKAPDDSLNTINAQSKYIAANLRLDDRIESLASKNSFISLKDHKENLSNDPTCRLINPSKSEIGKVSKQILDRINKVIATKTGVKQWKNTKATLDWFRAIPNKKQCSFISFDVVNFYPSISHDLLSKALKFADAFTDITDEEKEIIYSMQNNPSFSTMASPGQKRTPVTRSMSGRARTEQRPAS